MEQLSFSLEPTPAMDVAIFGGRLVDTAHKQMLLDPCRLEDENNFREAHRQASEGDRVRVKLIMDAISNRETTPLSEIVIQ